MPIQFHNYHHKYAMGLVLVVQAVNRCNALCFLHPMAFETQGIKVYTHKSKQCKVILAKNPCKHVNKEYHKV